MTTKPHPDCPRCGLPYPDGDTGRPGDRWCKYCAEEPQGVTDAESLAALTQAEPPTDLPRATADPRDLT